MTNQTVTWSRNFHWSSTGMKTYVSVSQVFKDVLGSIQGPSGFRNARFLPPASFMGPMDTTCGRVDQPLKAECEASERVENKAGDQERGEGMIFFRSPFFLFMFTVRPPLRAAAKINVCFYVKRNTSDTFSRRSGSIRPTRTLIFFNVYTRT